MGYGKELSYMLEKGLFRYLIDRSLPCCSSDANQNESNVIVLDGSLATTV